MNTKRLLMSLTTAAAFSAAAAQTAADGFKYTDEQVPDIHKLKNR